MKPFLERIESGPVIIADGAMGSFLMERGLGPGESPESMNLTRPEVLREIAGLYLEAGAELVQTNTFGGSAIKLALYDLDDRTEEINRKAVEAVRETVDDRAYVSGSCGPCGGMLKPYGDLSPDDMRESFRRQMSALVGAGVDVLCVETMTDMGEATIAVETAREVSADIPVMATMTFDATPRGFYTIMGVDIPGAASALLAAGANLVGSNCGNGIENMVEIARQFRACTDAPLLIQSNAGLPETVGGEVVYPETPEFMAEKARGLLDAGVSVIGGCCGTTPEHTRAIASALRPGSSGHMRE
ncbi:MAG: methionine synthase [Candidatus Eisenbacteria bacterium]|nr:methionine synthase [Candidatus Eisenbacteria bacterium]